MTGIRTPWRMLATALVMAALAACTDEQTPGPTGPDREETQAESDTVPAPLDGDLYPAEKEALDLAQQIPGYAGDWHEGDTHFVALTAAGKADEASRVLDARPAPEHGQHGEVKTGGGRQFLPASFDYLTLRGFRDRAAAEVLSVEGTTFLDLDERENRVVIGIVDETPRGEVEAKLKEAGVPAGATQVLVTGKIEEHQTLQQFKRPLEGAWQIQNANGPICTLGFITRNPANGAASFVTNSHCTAAYWGLDGISFSQNLNNLWVGREVRDPAPFGCALFGLIRCRWSDAAIVQVNGATVAFNRIAKTSFWAGPNFGPFGSIQTVQPSFTVTGVQPWPFLGQIVDKNGRTSGWTYGRVTRTCVTMPRTATRWRLCQFWATYTSKPGDSGSPVFIWHGDNVTLAGINWGGSDFLGQAFFSAAQGMRWDLGVP